MNTCCTNVCCMKVKVCDCVVRDEAATLSTYHMPPSATHGSYQLPHTTGTVPHMTVTVTGTVPHMKVAGYQKPQTTQVMAARVQRE